MNNSQENHIDAWVERCRNGDALAYFEVYRRYEKRMLNSSMRVLNNLADAEDMVQEAFADAFSDIRSFTYKSSFEAWLRRIVINKSISLVRKKRMYSVPLEPDQLLEESEVLFNDVYIDPNIAKIKKVLKLLPDLHRIIFNLFVIEEIPQKEIAILLDISHNHVRTIYHRSRKKIQKLLIEEIQ